MHKLIEITRDVATGASTVHKPAGRGERLRAGERALARCAIGVAHTG